MFSPRLIIISKNDKYMTKEIGKRNGKVKYQLFSVAIFIKLIGKEKFVLEP